MRRRKIIGRSNRASNPKTSRISQTWVQLEVSLASRLILTDFRLTLQQAFKNVVAATRAANAFPQGTARSLYLSYPGFARVMDNLSQRVVGLIGNVLHAKEVKGDVRK